jgi:hypothetical protein
MRIAAVAAVAMMMMMIEAGAHGHSRGLAARA